MNVTHIPTIGMDNNLLIDELPGEKAILNKKDCKNDDVQFILDNIK